MDRSMLQALEQAVALAGERSSDRVPVVGVAGSQGSGKTTLVSAYASMHPKVAHFSLDDVYLPKAGRENLAQHLHPLFATRGVPGTHDMDLLTDTLDALQGAGADAKTKLPVFDKATDERAPESRWPVFEGRPTVILLDGWCLGAREQEFGDLVEPVNALEAEEDAQAIWRGCVNDFLFLYQIIFARLDAVLLLEAPSFEIVQDWRCQQEEGLLGRELLESDKARIARFIAHYERITRHMLAGGRRAEVCAQLDEQRRVKAVRMG